MKRAFLSLAVAACVGLSAVGARAQTPAVGPQSLLPMPSAWGQSGKSTTPYVQTSHWENNSAAYHDYYRSDDDAPHANPGGGAFDDALCGPSCGPCCCPAPCGPIWFGAVGGLLMERNQVNERQLSFDVNNVAGSLIGTRDVIPNDWNGGFEVSFGRMIGDNHVLGVTYWTLDPFSSFVQARSPNNQINTTINLANVTLGGVAVDQFFDASPEHRAWLRDEIHNIEINLYTLPFSAGGVFNVNWLAGVRYFRFNEGFRYGSVAFGETFGSDGGINEAYLDFDVRNSLIGAQIGSDANWLLIGRLSGFLGCRAGIYGNHIRNRAELVRGDGLQGFDLRSHKNDVSFLGELNTGLNYWFTNNISGYLGYRVVFVNGVALSTNQIPQFLADTNGMLAVDSNASLVVHGFMAGGQVAF